MPPGDARRARRALLSERHQPPEPGADLQAGGRSEGEQPDVHGGGQPLPFEGQRLRRQRATIRCQGNCNGLRLQHGAERPDLAGGQSRRPTRQARIASYLLIGDFNAYFGEDPIQAFLGSNGYTDLINLLLGPNAYSYNFGSQAGYLDHGLVNAAFIRLIKASPNCTSTPTNRPRSRRSTAT